jgi:hypothetical protein
MVKNTIGFRPTGAGRNSQAAEDFSPEIRQNTPAQKT